MRDNFRKRILEDDVYLAASRFKDKTTVFPVSNWTDAQKIRRNYEHAVVLNDGGILSQLAIAALAQNVGKNIASLSLLGTHGKPKAYGNDSDETSILLQSPQDLPDNSCLFLFADTRQTDSAQEWVRQAEAILTRMATLRNCRCVVCVVIPEMDPLPTGILDISEREFDFMLESKPVKSESETFLLNVQTLCQKAVRDMGADVSLLRVSNLFGPLANGMDGSDLTQTIQNILSGGHVEIADADFRTVRSFTYTSDAVIAAFWTLWHGKGGHEYHYVTANESLATVKEHIRNAFPEKFSLRCECGTVAAPSYACLNPLKFSATRFRSCYPFSQWIVRTVCYLDDCPYPNSKNKSIYSGKLDRIKSMEMRMLRAVDDICVRHGLKYFIAAGSLLGAKRYGHNIPWDDDLDIAFLRNDFEKFRKVCEKELPPEFVYCSWFNGQNSHYPVDKIRVRDTYFSTRYSSINTIEDGIFLDILVYDATSDFAPLAWIHNKTLGVFSWFLLQMLWRNPPRHNFRSLPSYLLYKALRVFPIGFYHWLFERILKAFRFKRHPKYLVDGTGARAGIKKIPAAGLFDVQRIPFDEGFSAPSPIDPEDYLVFAYGHQYLKEPPLSEQHGHALARIDLGKYLFDSAPVGKGRPLDIRGELYETNHPETTISA